MPRFQKPLSKRNRHLDDDDDDGGDDDDDDDSGDDDDDDAGKNNWVWGEFRGVPRARISGARPPRIYAKRKFHMCHHRHHHDIVIRLY